MILALPTPFPLVRLNAVTLRLGSKTIFFGLSLDLNAKEHTAILGPNGVGKSSLLRLLQGDLRLVQDHASDVGGAQDGGEGPGTVLWNFEGHSDASPLSAREYVRLVSPRQQHAFVRRGWDIRSRQDCCRHWFRCCCQAATS